MQRVYRCIKILRNRSSSSRNYYRNVNTKIQITTGFLNIFWWILRYFQSTTTDTKSGPIKSNNLLRRQKIISWVIMGNNRYLIIGKRWPIISHIFSNFLLYAVPRKFTDQTFANISFKNITRMLSRKFSFSVYTRFMAISAGRYNKIIWIMKAFHCCPIYLFQK